MMKLINLREVLCTTYVILEDSCGRDAAICFDTGLWLAFARTYTAIGDTL